MTTEYKIIGGVVLITLVIIVGGAWLSGKGASGEKERLAQPLVGEEVADPDRRHVPDGTELGHGSNPPTGGPHYVDSQNAGIYGEPIADGYLIHSMEHGAVILWYKSDLPQEQVDQLKEIYRSVTISKKIMMPRVGLDIPVALTSWGRLLKLEFIDEAKITEFMVTNNDRGPEKAPI